MDIPLFILLEITKKAGGVSIYIKSSFSTNKMFILYLSNLYIDTITIEIKLDIRNIIISSIYISSSMEKDSFVYLNMLLKNSMYIMVNIYFSVGTLIWTSLKQYYYRFFF